MIIDLPVIPPDLGIDYCFTTWQQLANDMVGGAVVQFDATGSFGLLVQSTTPSAAQRNSFLWFNTTTLHLLRYDASIGMWLANHWMPPSDGRRMWWTGSAFDVDTIDGGSAGVATLTSGPFFEIDHDYDTRVPLGAGTFPVSGTVVAPGATAGTESVVLVKNNLPADTIDVKTAIIGNAGVGNPEPVVGNTYGSDALAGSGDVVDSTSTSGGFAGRYYARGQTLPLGSAAPVGTLPPYRAGFWLRRSARQFFTS